MSGLALLSQEKLPIDDKLVKIRSPKNEEIESNIIVFVSEIFH